MSNLTNIQEWLRKTQRRFFSGKQFLQTENEVSITETPGRSSRWVVSRSLCHFTRLDLSSVPAGKRGGALENRITLLSPYKNPGYWAMWETGTATLWIWDENVRAKHLQALSAKGEDCAALEVLPESAFSERQEKGNFIYKSLNGFIGQCWTDRVLVQESYWPDYPTQSEWHQFLRGSGQPPGEPPESTAIAFDSAPWRIGQITARKVQAFEIQAAFALLTFFLILFSYQLTGTLRLTITNLILNARISGAEAIIAPTVALRDKVFVMHNNNALLSELASDSQTRDMLLIAKLLPPGSNITEWHFQSGQLEIVLQDPTQDLESYVRALESAVEFSHVTLEPLPRRQQLRITMQVLNV